MCDHSAACNPHWHIRHRKSTIKRVQWVTPDLVQLHNTATDRRYARSHSNTLPVKKLEPLTTRSSSLRCVLAAEHHLAEQYSKTGSTKPLKHLPRRCLSWNTCHYFLKLPTLRSFSGNRVKMLLKSHLRIKCHSQYNKVIGLLQHCSPIVNAGDGGCIVHDLETIIVLVLLAFNFIPQRSHHSLTLTRSRLRDSATVTLTPGDGTTAIKVESLA